MGYPEVTVKQFTARLDYLADLGFSRCLVLRLSGGWLQMRASHVTTAFAARNGLRLLSLGHAELFKGARGSDSVPAYPTRRRMRALQRNGWSAKEINKVGGLTEFRAPLGTIGHNATGRSISASRSKAFAKLYKRLCETEGPSEPARHRAEISGYLAPSDWKDIEHPVAPDGTIGDFRIVVKDAERSKQRRLREMAGIDMSVVPVDRVRDRVTLLYSIGFSAGALSHATDVSIPTLLNIVSGSQQNNHRAVSKKIEGLGSLDVFEDAEDFMGVASFAARRRVRALMCAGWAPGDVDRWLASPDGGAVRSRSAAGVFYGTGDSITAGTHRAIERAYEELCATEGPSHRNKNKWLESDGYLPALWWNEIDVASREGMTSDLDWRLRLSMVDDFLAGKEVALSGAEMREVVRRKWQGNLPELAELTGLGRRPLRRYAKSKGRRLVFE